MKKALAIILSVMMLMSTLVACGSKTDDSGDANNDAAASYPTKNVNVIVPFSAGGNTDMSMRALLNVATSLDSKYTFVVDNKTGNAGLIGMEALAEADPDGYTLGAPDDVLAALRDLMGKAVESDEYKTQIESLGMQYITLYGDELNTFINEQMAFYKDICADIDING